MITNQTWTWTGNFKKRHIELVFKWNKRWIGRIGALYSPHVNKKASGRAAWTWYDSNDYFHDNLSPILFRRKYVIFLQTVKQFRWFWIKLINAFLPHWPCTLHLSTLCNRNRKLEKLDKSRNLTFFRSRLRFESDRLLQFHRDHCLPCPLKRQLLFFWSSHFILM